MAIIDPWDRTPDELSFGRAGATITPSDTADLPTVAKGLFVCAAGNVKFTPVDNADDAPITITSAPVGLVIPWFVKRVFSTSTTATVASIDK